MISTDSILEQGFNNLKAELQRNAEEHIETYKMDEEQEGIEYWTLVLKEVQEMKNFEDMLTILIVRMGMGGKNDDLEDLVFYVISFALGTNLDEIVGWNYEQYRPTPDDQSKHDVTEHN